MGSVETKTGRSPALLKIAFDSLSSVVPPLSEALQPFSTVVLTGGSSGIGKSFIQLGGTLKPELVFCNLSRRPPAENIFSNSAKRLNHFSCDLSQAVDIERGGAAVREFIEREVPTGRILLINNSGFGSFGPFLEDNLARELGMIDLNVRGVVHLTGLLLPVLKARGGAIINIASTVAFQPTPFAATYGATKVFVLHWTVALNHELRGSGVHALAVCPGTTTTAFFRTAGAGDEAANTPLRMSPDRVVETALRALAARRTHVVPGFWNKLYALAGAKLPLSIAARIAGNVLGRRSGHAART